MNGPCRFFVALFLWAGLAAGCQRREFPAGFSKAWLGEAVKMAEAIVPFCQDLLADPRR